MGALLQGKHAGILCHLWRLHEAPHLCQGERQVLLPSVRARRLLQRESAPPYSNESLAEGSYAQLSLCAQLLISMHAAVTTRLADVEAISSSVCGGRSRVIAASDMLRKVRRSCLRWRAQQEVALHATSGGCLSHDIIACRIKKRTLGWWYLP